MIIQRELSSHDATCLFIILKCLSLNYIMLTCSSVNSILPICFFVQFYAKFCTDCKFILLCNY